MLRLRNDNVKQLDVLELVEVVRNGYNSTIEEVQINSNGWKKTDFSDMFTRFTDITFYFTNPISMKKAFKLLDSLSYDHPEFFKVSFNIFHYTFTTSGKKEPDLAYSLRVHSMESAFID